MPNKSIKLYKKAKKLIPGGVSLFSKRPENILPKLWPTYFIKTNGLYVWDLNKRKYEDFFLVLDKTYLDIIINMSIE